MVDDFVFNKLHFSNFKIYIHYIYIDLHLQHGESTKNLNREKHINTELQDEVNNFKSQISEIKGELEKSEKIGTENLALVTEIETVSQDYKKLQRKHEELRKEYQRFSDNKNSEIAELTVKAVQLQTESLALLESQSKVVKLEEKLNTMNDAFTKKQMEHAVLVEELKRDLENKNYNINELQTIHEKEITEKADKIKELELSLNKMEQNSRVCIC